MAAPIFGGTGTVGGSLRNFTGVVSPGNSPGALHINQDFTQGPQGTLLIEIAGRDPASFDHLIVGHNAFLDGTVRFVTLNHFQPARGGDRFVFLTAATGISGTFSSVVLDAPLLGGRVVYTATTAELDVARRPILSLFSGGNAASAPATQPAPLTPNQTAVAQSLDRGIDDRRLIHLFDQLDRYPARSLPAALDLIAPDELSAIYEIGIGTANVQAFNLDRHLSDVRAGARGFSAGRLSLTGVAAGPGQDARRSMARTIRKRKSSPRRQRIAGTPSSPAPANLRPSTATAIRPAVTTSPPAVSRSAPRIAPLRAARSAASSATPARAPTWSATAASR